MLSVKEKINEMLDDIAITDDLEAIATARKEYLHGETVSHEAIDWD